MAYQMVEIEVTEPLPSLVLASDETGYGLIVRQRGRVIGFVMQPRDGDGTLDPVTLIELLGRALEPRALQERPGEELTRPIMSGERPAPSLSVAVCTKDRPDALDRCLNSLVAVRAAAGQHKTFEGVELLVVDNAPSDDRTAKVVAGYDGVRRVVEPKPGLDFARNRALREAQGELLAFVDDDATVDPGWLEGLHEAWAENPDAGCFTGQILPYELKTEAQIRFETTGGFRKGFEKVRFEKSYPRHRFYPCYAPVFGVGCNMAFQRDVMLRLGGFDEALDTGAPLPGGGDHDAFYRIIRAGYPIAYEPRYLVYHEHRREMRQLKHMYWTWGLAFMSFLVKSYQADPTYRPMIRKLIVWWFMDEARQVARSLRHPKARVWHHVLAEIAGGVVGLCGEYPRSVRRIERIRRSYSEHATGAPRTAA